MKEYYTIVIVIERTTKNTLETKTRDISQISLLTFRLSKWKLEPSMARQSGDRGIFKEDVEQLKPFIQLRSYV